MTTIIGIKIFQAKAEELYQHPERVKLEVENRKKSDPKNYDSYAGPFDITLIKLDTKLKFTAVVSQHILKLFLKQNK